ncbi:MAG: OmpA family protein [Polyangiaceae bacterium]
MAESPPRARLPLLVAPTTSAAHNTFRPELLPIACCRLDDVRFGFESSFIRAAASTELERLSAFLAARPGVVLSVFGHADPVGDDAFNKALSGRRAAAVYGLLVRDVALWERLYSSPLGADDWGLPVIRAMLDRLAHAPGSFDLVPDTTTASALAAFQSANDLPPTGQADPATRASLFARYMDAVCVDAEGTPFSVPRSQFLGRGTDEGGKADYQGCGELNPVLLFSKSELSAFAAAPDKAERNRQNAPNRRAVVYLFRPGARVDPAVFPCPRATEGPADCQKRLWSDAANRRKTTEVRREAHSGGETFACRFYERLAVGSPCEDTPRRPPPNPLVAGRIPSRFSVGKTFPKPSSIAMLREVVRRLVQDPSLRLLVTGHTDRTGPDGMNLLLSRNRAAAVRAFLLGDASYFRERFGEADPVERWDWEEVQWMLSAQEIDGDPFYVGFVDGHCSDMTLAALQSFQLSAGMDATHLCDEETLTALIDGYLSLLGEERPRPEQIEIVGGGSWHPPRTFGPDSAPTADLLSRTDLLPGYRRVEVFLSDRPFFPPTQVCAPTRHEECAAYEQWCRSVVTELPGDTSFTMSIRFVDMMGRALSKMPVSLHAYLEDEGETVAASLTTSRYGTLRLTAPPGPYAVSFTAAGSEQRAAFQIHPDEVGGLTVRVHERDPESPSAS